MAGYLEFGKFFKEKRIALKLTLREFCRRNGFDPGNISKLERGILLPAKDKDRLAVYASALGLTPGTSEWDYFFDLADIANRRIPEDLTNDQRLLNALPVLFRTVRGKETDEEARKKLIEYIKKELKVKWENAST